MHGTSTVLKVLFTCMLINAGPCSLVAARSRLPSVPVDLESTGSMFDLCDFAQKLSAENSNREYHTDFGDNIRNRSNLVPGGS